MFEHVGMVAGVKSVTVAEHGAAKCENSGYCNGCVAIKHETLKTTIHLIKINFSMIRM